MTTKPVKIIMPSGATLDLTRPRSSGPLSAEEFNYCKQHYIPLSYDPVAYGWVYTECEDDIAPDLSYQTPQAQFTRSGVSLSWSDLENQLGQAFDSLFENSQARQSAPKKLIEEVWRLPELIFKNHRLSALDQAGQIETFCRLQQQLAGLLDRTKIADETIRNESLKFNLNSKRVGFRPWSNADVDRYVELLDDPLVWKHLAEPYPNPLTKSDASNLIEVSNVLSTHEVRAVRWDEEIVGQIRLQFQGSSVSPGLDANDAEVSYWLGKPYWGQGMMTEILRLYTKLSFQEYPLKSLSAWVDRDNDASIRVLEKCGFRCIGDHIFHPTTRPRILIYRAFRIQFQSPGSV